MFAYLLMCVRLCFIYVCVVYVYGLCTFCSMPFPYGTGGAQVVPQHVLMIPETEVFDDMDVAAEVRRAKVCT